MTRQRPTTLLREIVARGSSLIASNLAKLSLDLLPVSFDHVVVIRFLSQRRVVRLGHPS